MLLEFKSTNVVERDYDRALVVVPFLSDGSNICWNRTLTHVIDEECIHKFLLEADQFICLFSLD